MKQTQHILSTLVFIGDGGYTKTRSHTNNLTLASIGDGGGYALTRSLRNCPPLLLVSLLAIMHHLRGPESKKAKTVLQVVETMTSSFIVFYI